MIKNRFAAFSLFAVLVIFFWNLFDWIYSTVIKHGTYRFGIGTDLLMPLVVAIAMGYFVILKKGKDIC